MTAASDLSKVDIIPRKCLNSNGQVSQPDSCVKHNIVTMKIQSALLIAAVATPMAAAFAPSVRVNVAVGEERRPR